MNIQSNLYSRSPAEILAMFKKLNQDSIDSGEEAVPFTDTDYYEEQICELFFTGDFIEPDSDDESYIAAIALYMLTATQ